MSIRTLEAPGIELNEIDRSQAQKVDYSLPNAPTCFVTGFASKGEDYTLQWINSRTTLDQTFGTPENEPETWFYNAICEILNRGGIALGAKLPYDNASLQKYTWRQWTVAESPTLIDDSYRRDCVIHYIRDIYNELSWVLEQLGRDDDIYTIGRMWEVVKDIAIKEFQAKVESKEDIVGGVIYTFDSLVFPKFKTETKFLKTVGGIAHALETIVRNLKINPYLILKLNDSEITSYLEISDDGSGVESLDVLDKHLTYSKSLLKNKIRIYDITRSQYAEYDRHNCVKSVVQNELQDTPVWTNECLGIVPVLVTAPQAMYFQNLLETIDTEAMVSAEHYVNILGSKHFNVISGFGTLESGKCNDNHLTNLVSTYFDAINISGDWTTLPLSSSNPDDPTVSRDAAMCFPQITWKDEQHYEKEYIKHVGVVVFKAFKDTANDSNISFQPLEAFVGTLDRSSKDKITHASTFIDNVVNSRSRFIRLFSNVDRRNLERASTLVACNQRATSLGFYKMQCKKTISKQVSILDALTKILDQSNDPNTVPIDLVVDGGVSNIAQLVQSAGNGSVDFDLYPKIADFGTRSAELFCKHGDFNASTSDIQAWNLKTANDTKVWRQVLKKFDDFCKFTRKDCMFLADGLRTFCLEGDEKLVRKTKPSSSVIQTILSKIKFMSNALNSSYSAGWCNWFLMEDFHSGDLFWCPPSIKASSVCIYCDTYFHTWDAPAGMTRGIVPNVVDCAFSPTNSEAGVLYSHQWNYAITYPLEGPVLEGQKTFQTSKTALDRINVRRLLLDLEKKISRVSRNFLYEGNTEWLRQRFVDQLTPIFEEAVTGSGIIEYGIRCDADLNPPEVIDNHELHCKIALIPVKTLEWLVLDLICCRQGASINEELAK